MKVAKLEMKMIVAMFVVGYEYDVVDSKGRISKRLPVPDYNNVRRVRTFTSPICAMADRACFIFMTITRLSRRESNASSSSSVLLSNCNVTRILCCSFITACQRHRKIPYRNCMSSRSHPWS
jgi:hypothetical protein